jgi:GntR family transcriptional regulator/MocR family aminotransferase
VQLTVQFPARYDIDALVEDAAKMGVKVQPLTPFYADPSCPPPGLILGYANQTEAQILAGIRTLAHAARQSSPRNRPTKRRAPEYFTHQS